MGARVIVIGLDGATFTLLDPWMEAGLLPHLKRFKEAGVRGTLESTRPPHSGPAWASFMTGTNPGKHGVFGFQHAPDHTGHRRLVTLNTIEGVKFWDVLGAHGKRVGIVNLPMTYPPAKINGFMISGLMTPGPEADYTYPPSLKAEIRQEVGDYVVEPEAERFDPEDPVDSLAYLDLLDQVTRTRGEVCLRLMARESWDCLVWVFVFPDRVQHRFWKYLDPSQDQFRTPAGERIRGKVQAIFCWLDGFIGAALHAAGPETDCLIISDHGFGPLEGYLHVNRLLLDQGYLALTSRSAIRAKAGTSRVKRAVKAVVPDPLWRVLRQKLARRSRALWEGGRVEHQVDWTRTKAYFPGFPEQGIYIMPQTVGANNYDSTREGIRALLLSVRDPRTSRPLMDNVTERERLYHGSLVERGPDLLFIARDYAVWGHPRLHRSEIYSPEEGARGYHRPDGILLAKGAHFRIGQEVHGAHIMDIAPTILYLLGVGIPEEMDGRVLTEVMTEDALRQSPVNVSEFAARPAPPLEEEVFSPEDEEAINARLRGLGYIE